MCGGSFISRIHGPAECAAGVQMQMRAKEHCRYFNNFSPPKAVDILACFVVRLESLEEGGEDEVYACEPLMVGDYVKHNSNCGFVDDSDTRCAALYFIFNS